MKSKELMTMGGEDESNKKTTNSSSWYSVPRSLKIFLIVCIITGIYLGYMNGLTLFNQKYNPDYRPGDKSTLLR